jgi:hypothetical protein
VAWKPDEVRAFRERDWNAFERAPVTRDAAASEAIAMALYEEVRAAQPGWPSAAERDDDLRAHLRLVELFDRVHDARRRRRDAR